MLYTELDMISSLTEANPTRYLNEEYDSFLDIPMEFPVVKSSFEIATEEMERACYGCEELQAALDGGYICTKCSDSINF